MEGCLIEIPRSAFAFFDKFKWSKLINHTPPPISCLQQVINKKERSIQNVLDAKYESRPKSKIIGFTSCDYNNTECLFRLGDYNL